jgi:hypothetical protein
MELLLLIIQWVNILSILIALVFLLVSTKRYQGVIGDALMYLAVGIVLSALLSVVDLLQKTIEFNTFERIAGFTWVDLIHSGFVTFSFLMIAAGFYKLSKIYKRF